MPFRPPRKQPQFADLKGILAQTRDTESPLYQVIQEIIDRLTQFQAVTIEQVTGITGEIENALKNVANKNATYHTKENEVPILPNSVQLLAGFGITFDDSVANKRTISVSSNRYDAPLTDGDVDETHLIFALGECIIVQVPVLE